MTLEVSIETELAEFLNWLQGMNFVHRADSHTFWVGGMQINAYVILLFEAFLPVLKNFKTQLKMFINKLHK